MRKLLRRRRRFGRALAEMHYQLRTESTTPLRQAASVWLGTFVGCTPFWGLHLALCVALAKLLALSRIRAYLAAHINNPLTLPFLLYLEAGVGRWLFTGAWPSLRVGDLGKIGLGDLGALGRDLIVGSLVVGAALGTLFGVASFVIAVRWREAPFRGRLREEISHLYVATGVWNWEAVRGQLRHDPLAWRLFELGLPDGGTWLDVGCGRGVPLAVTAIASGLRARGEWPAELAAPPRHVTLVGVEPRRRLARVARVALGEHARIGARDLDALTPPACQAILLLDILHRLVRPAQDGLLDRLVAALAPGGVLLLRELDAAAGARFGARRRLRRGLSLLFGRRREPEHYRAAPEWERALRERGLATERVLADALPRSQFLVRAWKPVDEAGCSGAAGSP